MKVVLSCPGTFWSDINGRRQPMPSHGTVCCGVPVPIGDTEMDLDEAKVKAIQVEIAAKRTQAAMKVVEQPKKK